VLHLQNEDNQACPDVTHIQQWVAAALAQGGCGEDAELTVRIVGEDEMRELNLRYRGKPGTTNVLSFPADLPPELQLPLLGDIVICAPVVVREAREQHKSTTAHWAHMVVHGTLHLQGYDHQDDTEAAAMEQLETTILDTLHFASPYAPSPTNNSQRPAAP
jgi:probable rRNA maturation factor